MAIIVTKQDGTQFPLVSTGNKSVITQGEQKIELLGEDVIAMNVVSAKPLSFDIGDTIEVYGYIYTINALPEMTKRGNRVFAYSLVFEGIQYELLKAQYLDLDSQGLALSGDFSVMFTLNAFCEMLIRNANRAQPGRWTLGECPDTDSKNMSFADENCLSALQRVCEEFEFEFWIKHNNGINTINIGTVGSELPHEFAYGRGKGLYELKRQTVDSENIVTRLYAFGADKNLKSSYRGHSRRLKLPDAEYLEDTQAQALYGTIEATKNWDEIYPRRKGGITALGGNVLTFVDATMDFDLNEKDSEGNTKWLIAGTSAKIAFTSGNLAGYDFDVESYNHTTKTFVIVAFDDERGQTFPDSNTTAFQFSVGDNYVIYDIMMPDSYIANAENELLEAAQAFLSENKHPRVSYECVLDDLYLKRTAGSGSISNVFSVGDYVTVRDESMNIDGTVRIQGFTRDIISPYKYTLTLSDFVQVTRVDRLVSDAADIKRVIHVNRLNNPQRIRENWRTLQEMLDMVFDTDGYFDADRIKPLSIETSMLAVGAKPEQFTTNVIIEPNYQGNPNLVNITGGTLVHLTVEENPRSWNIQSGQVTLASISTAYYIYLRCFRASGNTYGQIYFTTEQIKVDDDATYYHFLMGVIHSVSSQNVRWISLSYGSTSINGRFIKTGRLQSADGRMYIDLDTGDIVGDKITFFTNSGAYRDIRDVDVAADTAQNTANSVQSIANAANAAAQSAQTTASTAQQTANTEKTRLDTWASDGIVSPTEKTGLKQQQVDIQSEYNEIDSQATLYGLKSSTEWTQYNSAYSSANAAFNKYTATTPESITIASDFNNIAAYYPKRQAILDLIAVKAKEAVDNIEVGGRNLIRNSGQFANTSNWGSYSNVTGIVIGTDAIYGSVISCVGVNSNARFSANTNFNMLANDNIVISAVYKLSAGTLTLGGKFVDNTNVEGGSPFNTWGCNSHEYEDLGGGWKRVVGRYAVPAANPYNRAFFYFTIGNANFFLAYVKVEKGNKPTDWTLAPEDVQAAVVAAESIANAAQTSATTANNLLSDIANDNKLTADEKQSVKLEWDIIVGEKGKIDAEADRYVVSKTAYGNAYTSLNSYITPLLANLNATSDINGNTFRTNFVNYYNSRQDLLNAITTKAKSLIDNIEVGGRNLIRNSGQFSDASHWGGYAGISSIVKSSDSIYGSIISAVGTVVNARMSNSAIFNMSAGENIVISAVYKLSTGAPRLAGKYIADNGQEGDGSIGFNTWECNTHEYEDLPNGWKRAVGKFAVPANNPYNRAFFYFFINAANFSLAHAKVEKGNKPSDWTPAPEDVPSSLTYLTAAMKQSTTIDGGLINSSIIQLGENGIDRAGINGVGAAENTVRIWAGGTLQEAVNLVNNSAGNKASFAVLQSGKLFATNAEISGRITATSGSFTGTINATGGAFAGKVTAGFGNYIEIDPDMNTGSTSRPKISLFSSFGIAGELRFETDFASFEGRLNLRKQNGSEVNLSPQLMFFVQPTAQQTGYGNNRFYLIKDSNLRFEGSIEGNILDVTMRGLPSSNSGLASGRVWRDTSGYLRCV